MDPFTATRAKAKARTLYPRCTKRKRTDVHANSWDTVRSTIQHLPTVPLLDTRLTGLGPGPVQVQVQVLLGLRLP